MADEDIPPEGDAREGGSPDTRQSCGTRDLAKVCAGLSALSDEDAKTAANHFIYADYMNSADDGSIPMMVCLTLDV